MNLYKVFPIIDVTVYKIYVKFINYKCIGLKLNILNVVSVINLSSCFILIINKWKPVYFLFRLFD